MITRRIGLFLMIGLLLLLASAALAAEQGYSLNWWTVDGGGQAADGDYSLSGAIGQPDAGRLAGGVFVLEGGFFAGDWPDWPPEQIFLPVVVR